MTWTSGTVTIVNPTGGLLSSFTSYGTEAELDPQAGHRRPGWPHPLDVSARNSPAGATRRSAARRCRRLTSPAPQHFCGRRDRRCRRGCSVTCSRTAQTRRTGRSMRHSGFLDNVHRQGAGMVDIDDAIASTTTVLPGKLSLGESQAGPATRTLTLQNSSGAPVTYNLSHVEAIATGPETFPPALVLAARHDSGVQCPERHGAGQRLGNGLGERSPPIPSRMTSRRTGSTAATWSSRTRRTPTRCSGSRTRGSRATISRSSRFRRHR